MKRLIITFLLLTFVFGLIACSGKSNNTLNAESKSTASISNNENKSGKSKDEENGIDNNKKEEMKMNISVNGHTLNANFADTKAAKELYELIKNEPLTLTLNEYGSFEKVGKLPQSFTKNDEQINAQPGDILLYQGNQMTIFYGENSWSYTRLGKIENITAEEIAEIFGDGDITVTISAETAEREFDFETKTVLLNSGYEMPIMGLGTYSLSDEECYNSVTALLESGGAAYRHGIYVRK